MVTKKTILFGVLILVVAATYVTITSGDVRIKIDSSATTFYVYLNNNWTIAGKEAFNLYNGTTRLVKSNTTISYATYNSPGVAQVVKATYYPGGQKIVQSYFFNANSTRPEDFPINQTVSVRYANGLILRYDATSLEYSGPTYSLTNQTSLSFGKKINIDFEPGYFSGKVYQSGGVRLQYKITGDSDFYQFRMYDPAAPTNITIYLNGTVANRTIEIGEPLNITAKSNVTGLSVCLSVNHSYLGDNFLCNTTTVTYIFNPTSSTRTFNDSTTSKNLNYSTTANQTVYIRQNTYDEMNSVRFNLTGVNTSGSNYPANVKVYVNNTLAKSIPGTLQEGATSLTTYNDSTSYKTFTYWQAGSQQAYFKMNKNAIVTDAYSNVSGSSLNTLIVNSTNSPYSLCGNYDFDVVKIYSSGVIQLSCNNISINAVNFSIDNTSKIIGDGADSNGGTSYNCGGGASGCGSVGTGTGYGGGGGGAGYGGAGYGMAGVVYGTQGNITTDASSGGGGGCCDCGASSTGNGGSGGTGGGIIIINSTYIQIQGNVTSNGGAGGDGTCSGASNCYGNGGGGGSGGSILILGKYVNISSADILANGGNGGGCKGQTWSCTGGGGGGGGRIKIFYKNTFYNTSSNVQAGLGAGGTPTGVGTSGGAGSVGTNWTAANTSIIFNVETGINIGETYYLLNPYIDIESDGDSEWSYTGTFNQTNNKTANFSDSLNHYLSLCTADADGNCLIPVAYGSGSAGIMNGSAISISLTVYFNPITIDNSYFQNFLDLYTTSSYQNIPIKIEANQGNVTMNGINISYNGTGVLNITASYVGNATYAASSSNKNLTIYHSNFIRAFPYSFMTEPIFLPVSINSTNVSMYGQTASKPGYNITGKGYSSNFNVSIRLNQSMDSCMNMTVGNANTAYNFTVNTTRRQILSNITLEQSAGLWLKLNLYNCNASTIYRNWWVELKSCCSTCMACY